MGSVLSGDGRETARTPDVGNPQGNIQFPQPSDQAGDVEKQQIPSFECAICLEVFDQPVRTKCGHVYPCPFCQNELDENDLLDHFLTFHRTERRPVYCPICRLLPGGGPSYYIRNFIRHLQLRHTFYYEDYIDINIVEEVLIERVLDRSVLDYVHVNNPGTA
ncbi:E3 ubiquitin-protein ligase RNF125-like [Ahaetulla prasina]|uniref:E3 ubiquitin-protein ligase RNF125-like n=1 Tax=Ahaetulla prasina TaxID=499056 RepID=UPI002648D1D7|nr:E3 ubiquitin-protein ligase RNF125-like [Ahaetulla prasina]